MAGYYSRVSDPRGGLIICVPNKLSGATTAPACGAHFGSHCLGTFIGRIVILEESFPKGSTEMMGVVIIVVGGLFCLLKEGRCSSDLFCCVIFFSC